jgi:outer membrane immunogenic protein
MIRRIFLVSASALALAGTALAADLPTHAPPPVFLPPPPMWTGFYIGVNAGYDWSPNSSTNINSALVFANPLAGVGSNATGNAGALGATGSLPLNLSGFIGGGQTGYNWQFYNNFVVGIEADIQGVAGAHQSDSIATSVGVAGFPGTFADSTLSTRKSLDYLGTVRGRFGYLITPTLLAYGTGGLAYGGINSSTAIAQQIVGVGAATVNAPYFAAGRVSNTKVGWTAGGGLEWMFLPNWSAKIEYLYYNLGSVNYGNGLLADIVTPPGGAVPTGGIFHAIASQSHTSFRGNVVRVGINYHFNWGVAPVVAKY